MRVAPFAVIVSVAVVGMLGACANQSKDAPLIAAVNSPIADVPVPAGFTMMKAQSTSKVVPGSGLRFVDHQYSGDDDFLPVAKFYKDQMPGKGWTWVDQSQGDSSVTLHFTKGGEDCYVTVKDGSLTSHTHLRVKIDPMARNAAK
jgi:hypothetical protein